MSVKLKLSDDLYLPLAIASQAVAIFGIRGSGKTNTAGVIAEELLRAGQPVVIIDPTDAWWGLRSEFDVFIFGGSHQDLPIAEGDGKTVAEFVVKEQVPLILSLRELRKSGQRKFVTEFCEELYHLKGKPDNRSPLTVFIDEAPLFAPAKVFNSKGEFPLTRTVGAIEDLIARGRNSGFGVVPISQRPATLNADVRSLCDTIIAHRIIGPLDRKAISLWIEENASVDEMGKVLESLAKLKNGEVWIWSPMIEIFQRVQIRLRDSYDSSATPKPGQQLRPPKKLREVDLNKLKGRLGAAIEEARSNDPKVLKARIAELEKQAKKPAPAVPAPVKAETKIVEKFVLKDGQLARADQIIEKLGKLVQKGTEVSQELTSSLAQITEAVRKIGQPQMPSRVAVPVRAAIPARKPIQNIPRNIPTAHPMLEHAGTNGHLPIGERKVLTACAQYSAGLRREQLTVLTGYKRSSRDAYIQRLREKQYVDVSGDLIIPMDVGIQALGNFEPLPTGDALRDYWLARLPIGERAMLEQLIAAYPNAVDRDALSEATGYQRSSRDAYLQRMSAKELVESVGRGEVKASANLFD